MGKQKHQQLNTSGHHISFPRASHESCGPAKEIRENRWLIPNLHNAGHIALHSEIAVVPVPSYHLARNVLKEFEPVPFDYLASLDNLIESYHYAMTHPRVKQIELKLGELIVMALEAQKPFIAEALVL